MQNQIRQLEDGTFEIGTWIQNANGEVVFFDATSAKTLEEANKIADELDDQEFKLAKRANLICLAAFRVQIRFWSS
ncbi:hypothetical protein OHV90_06960 [Acinetobacter baumannii]|nr:hypothetical protein [Acinetobacter baumannii]